MKTKRFYMITCAFRWDRVAISGIALVRPPLGGPPAFAALFTNRRKAERWGKSNMEHFDKKEHVITFETTTNA